MNEITPLGFAQKIVLYSFVYFVYRAKLPNHAWKVNRATAQLGAALFAYVVLALIYVTWDIFNVGLRGVILIHMLQVACSITICKFSRNHLETIGLSRSNSKELRRLILPVILLLFLGLHLRSDLNVANICLYLVSILVLALGEELFFRGIIQTRLQNILSSRKAIFATALIFGLYHLVGDSKHTLNLDQDALMLVGQTTILGLVFGYIFSKSKSIWPVVLLHACWDIAVGNVL